MGGTLLALRNDDHAAWEKVKLKTCSDTHHTKPTLCYLYLILKLEKVLFCPLHQSLTHHFKVISVNALAVF